MDFKISFKVAFLAGLAWTLGSFVGSIIQYFATNFAIAPLLQHFLGR